MKPSSHKLTRRQAMTAMLGAPAALLVHQRPEVLDAEVIVVGAGIGGLATLHRLRRLGISAVLLEASHRFGGRVRTLREGLTAGLRAEAGAERVPRGHSRVRELAAELGVGIVPYPDFPDTFEFRGRTGRWRIGDFDELPEEFFNGLSDFERAAAPLELALRYAESCVAPDTADRRSAWQWLLDQGLTARGQQLIDDFCWYPARQMSALAFWKAARRERETADSELIDGGSDRLTESLAALHRKSIRRRVRVVEIERHRERVELRDQRGRVHRARFCVLCLPLKVLGDISFLREAPAELTRRLERLVPEHEFKAHFEVTRRRRRRIPSVAYGITLPRASWALPETVEGRSIQTVMSPMRDLPPAGAHGALEKSLRAGLKGMLPRRAKLHFHDFRTDPLCGAAWCYEAPATTSRRGAFRDHRLVLAGADLSRTPGWMEGALQSAEEAVSLLRAL